MAGQSITFDFLSRGSATLQGDFRKTGDNAAFAAKGAKILGDAIDKLGAKEDRTAAESRILAKALRETGDAEDRVTARAVLADAAVRKLDDDMKAAARKREAELKVKVDDSALKKLQDSSFFKPSAKGSALSLAPALIPLAGATAGAIGAIGVSFGAAAAGAGIFGAAASSVLSGISTNLAKLQALEVTLNKATTPAAKKTAQAAIDALKATWSKGYLDLINDYQGFQGKWTKVSQAIAVPALLAWMPALTKGLGFLIPAVTPVANVFKDWGQTLNRYFSDPAVVARIDKMAASFGKFSAQQLRDVGRFIGDIAKGIFSLGKDLGASGADFGKAGTWLAGIGAGFATWAASGKARGDVQGFLHYLHQEGPVVEGILSDLGNILPGIFQGATAAGGLELKAIAGFLGLIAGLPKGWQAPLTEAAGALLLLSKTGVIKVGFTIVGAVASWVKKLTGGATVDLGAAGMQRAGDTMVGAAGAMQRAADTMVGGGGLGGVAGKGAGAAGTAAEGGLLATGSAGLGALVTAPLIGAAAGIALGIYLQKYHAQDKPPPAAQQGPRGTGGAAGPSASSINAWKVYDGLVTGTWKHVDTLNTKLPPLLTNFDRQGKAAKAAGTELGNYTSQIVASGINSDRSKPSRQRLIDDLIKAGVNSKTAKSDVDKYGAAVQKNGADSDQARGARQRLNTDIEKAFKNSQQGKTDMGKFTDAVRTHSAQSDAVRGARQRLIQDLINSGVDANTAKTDVYNLQTAISTLHGKGITITMGGKGYYNISEAGKNYSISAGGLFSPHALGGFISGGTAGRDSVPIMAMPGEVVVPTAMVRRGAVDHLRGRLPGFAAGGAVSAGPAGIGRMYRDQVNDEGFSLVSAMRAALKTAEAAARAAQAAFGAGTHVPNVGSGVARWAGLVRKILAYEHLNPNFILDVLYQMMTESGGNPNAINLTDINAQQGHPSKGLMQVIAGTFARWHWPGTSGNIYDPEANIAAALNYGAHGRGFGTGPGQIGSGHGYAEGGLVGYASGGTVARQGRAWLNAWRSRRGGGYGAAWGPVAVNQQIAEMSAAVSRAKALAGASGLSAGQHRFWASTAADEKRRLGVLGRELTTERAWRTQLGVNELGLDKEIRAAGNLPSLAGAVRGWKTQMSRDKGTVTAISKMLGYSDAYIKAHPAAKPPVTGVLAKHSYGGDVANNLGTVLAAALGPFTGAARGGMVFDSGGTLKPGFNPVWNGTGRPEALVPARGGGRLQIEWVGGNGGDDLERWIRKNVRVRGGGDVQRAYGAR